MPDFSQDPAFLYQKSKKNENPKSAAALNLKKARFYGKVINMKQDLTNFIKYCLGYVKLTRQRTFVVQQKLSVELSKEYLGLIGLLNGDLDGEAGELVNLETFYSLDPKKVTEENQKKYEQERILAGKIEDIYNKYRNDQFRKQIVFNFGYFEIELPVEAIEEDLDVDNEESEQDYSVKTKIDKYPLFSLVVQIEKEEGKYVLYLADSEIRVNIAMIEPLIGQDLYYQLIEEIGIYEINEKLSLPIDKEDIFIDVWHKVKERLKHTKAQFDEDSFNLEEMRLAISPRSNYFLAEDLEKLSNLDEKELDDTALTGWIKDDELNIESDAPQEEELYFPFSYDKYKLRVLSLMNNRGSIIEGPPGTGKSETIANLLSHLAANGKRVLFVSQKAQALKVVKDKLKKLDVRYLFGYIPNPSSLQIGEEDEVDGIAPQLSALGSYIEALGYKFYTRKKLVEYNEEENSKSIISLNSVIKKKKQLVSYFIDSIEVERKLYKLYQEVDSLNNCFISVSNVTHFKENFSPMAWSRIKNLETEINKLSTRINEYEKDPQKKKFDNLFPDIKEWDSKYTEAIDKIKNDVEVSGYDRHSKTRRKINNALRNFRLKQYRVCLPLEIIDYIDNITNKDVSRNKARELLDIVYRYGIHNENKKELEELKNNFQELLRESGISKEEFQMLSNLLSKKKTVKIQEIKENTLRIREIIKELKGLKSGDINELSNKLNNVEKDRSKKVALYIQNIINKNIIEKWKTGVIIKQIIKKLAKAFGKSKKAFKTFDNLRKDPENFNVILDLIPVWIMELDDASRIIPLEAGIFDYVILDEASQCNIAYTLPAMFRAKKALFFGDSEQMRDNTIIFKSNKSFDELACRYQISEDLQIKATGSAVQSVLDMANLRGFSSVSLRNHYRSPEELIGFSNKYFYRPKGKELVVLNSNYLTYEKTDRIMLIHSVDSDWSEEFSDKVNVAEAKAILEFFKKLRNDKSYQDKSVGILSFFNPQATYIRELFEKEGFKEEKDNYKISIIEGIQGDEKDIIIYSFVIRNFDQKNKYIPLTGEGGDIKADINKGRVNVAFSRAKLQTHSFISLPIEEFPEKIWIKKYLRYVEESGKVNVHSVKLKPFDSYFEEEFYGFVRSRLKRGYKIQNQVESCGFKIDFVVSNIRNGKRIAIECDGPTHFEDELDEEAGIYIEDDEERQNILEAAGWIFYRVKYSDWINKKFNRKQVSDDVIKMLS